MKHTEETKQSRIVFDDCLNDHRSLFGGIAMKWMDEVAYITALRYSRQKMVTVNVNRINFTKSVKPGSLIEVIGKIKQAGNLKLLITVEIYTEDKITGKQELAISGEFTFAAVNANNKPIRLHKPELTLLTNLS